MAELFKFCLLLIFEIPAICMSIFIFIYFITHPLALANPKNHVWFVLLIFNFLQLIINLPMSMSFYYLGQVWPATNAYCVWWSWHQHSATFTCLILTIRASVERHCLIFRPMAIVGTSWKKWIFHFVPIILCITVASLWYIVLIVISPMCTNVWDFNYIICGIPCYQLPENRGYGIADTTMVIGPLFVLVMANIILMVRIIYEKRSRCQVVEWRRHRKMAIQLWLISSLYLAGWLPLASTSLGRLIAFHTFLDDQHATLIYIRDFIAVLVPFVCLAVFPEITTDVREFLRRKRRNRVGVVSIVLRTQPQTRI